MVMDGQAAAQEEESMVDFIMRGWENKSASQERAWLIKSELYEAEREFRRARARAIIRGITGRMKPATPAAMPAATPAATPAEHSAALPGADGLAHMVPIDAIVGMLDDQGRQTARLPVLRRRMAEAWRRMYREPDHNAHLPLSVVSGPGGWYLAGGAGALLVLEILRARGVGCVPVRTPVFDEEDDCCGVA
jgi:hypothetical protein